MIERKSRRRYRTPEAVMQGSENAGMGSKKMDANDISWCNEACIVHPCALNPDSIAGRLGTPPVSGTSQIILAYGDV